LYFETEKAKVGFSRIAKIFRVRSLICDEFNGISRKLAQAAWKPAEVAAQTAMMHSHFAPLCAPVLRRVQDGVDLAAMAENTNRKRSRRERLNRL